VKENFGKEYKLCSKLIIDEVFATGERLHLFPFQLIFLQKKNNSNVSFQILISVPKKKMRLSVDRNHVKRLIRESVRKNKVILESFLTLNSIQLTICLVYISNEKLSFSDMNTKICKLLTKLTENIQVQHES
jgi:ribonuclease P protein component